MFVCDQCPRRCRVERAEDTAGFCGAPEGFRVARAALHPWEEPPISGSRGSGTVFFSGCNLRCVFCQNREVSRDLLGKDVTPERLGEIFLRLAGEGAHNINLVTPSHYARQLIPVLEAVKPRLGIPVVWNSGGYDLPETLSALEGLVDVWLPDVKYFDPALSAKYSSAPDYFDVAAAALSEMLRQAPTAEFAPDGTMRRGVIVRHLVLPGNRADSEKVLTALAERFGTKAFLLSLMSQYTPAFAKDCAYPELRRKLTTYEYQKVSDLADKLGFDGFFQQKSSATSDYTPDFHQSQI